MRLVRILLYLVSAICGTAYSQFRRSSRLYWESNPIGSGGIRVKVSYFVFSVFLVSYCLIVSTRAVDCLERPVLEMTCYTSSGTLNAAHALQFPQHQIRWASD